MLQIVVMASSRRKTACDGWKPSLRLTKCLPLRLNAVIETIAAGSHNYEKNRTPKHGVRFK